MRYEAAVRYLLSLGRELAAPTQAAAAKFDLENILVLAERLDATNILSPLVTIITRIDFDHESFLGHSLREIAAEKAGILKPGVPVVLAEQRQEAREVIVARATELGCPVVEPSEVFQVTQESMEDGCVRARVIEVDSGAAFEIAPNLPGRFQLQNALNAVATARLLRNRGFQIIDDAVMRGIAETVWP